MTSAPSPEVPFLDLAALHAPLRRDLDAAIARVIDRSSYVLGAEVDAFETEFAAFVGTGQCVAVANGLDAITIALRALGVGPGDEVVVPGQTFVATWLAVTAAGATPVPADVSPLTGQIDPDAVAAAITERTAAIIAVHLFGTMAPMRALRHLATRHRLALVEDAAQAHGASLDGIPAGRWGDAAAFSFYPGKNLGALGDAGALVTPHADVADRARLLRNYGSAVRYQHEMQGTNSRMDELQAAVLRVKLPLVESWNVRRRAIADRYEEALTGRVELAHQPVGSVPARHLFPVLVADREEFRDVLTARGVHTLSHYPVLPSLSGAYLETHAAWSLPASARWAAEEVSLPMDPTLSEDQVDRVIEAVRSAVPELAPV